jgi:hypothetical protein
MIDCSVSDGKYTVEAKAWVQIYDNYGPTLRIKFSGRSNGINSAEVSAAMAELCVRESGAVNYSLRRPCNEELVYCVIGMIKGTLEEFKRRGWLDLFFFINKKDDKNYPFGYTE